MSLPDKNLLFFSHHKVAEDILIHHINKLNSLCIDAVQYKASSNFFTLSQSCNIQKAGRLRQYGAAEGDGPTQKNTQHPLKLDSRSKAREDDAIKPVLKTLKHVLSKYSSKSIEKIKIGPSKPVSRFIGLWHAHFDIP